MKKELVAFLVSGLVLPMAALATPSFAASCEDVRNEINAITNSPMSKASRSVLVQGGLYKLGMATPAQMRAGCDLYDDYVSEEDHLYGLQRQYVGRCNGTITTMKDEKITDLTSLSRNHEAIMQHSRNDHPEICAIADGKKPMPSGLSEY
jgi:hypothetical protein